MAFKIMIPPDPHYHLIRPPDQPMAHRGLSVLMNGPEKVCPEPPHVQSQVDPFLVYAQAAAIDIRRQVLVLQENKVVTTCLWVASPGRTAMLFTPNFMAFPEIANVSVAALRGAVNDAGMQGIHLVQSMVEPRDHTALGVFQAAGLRPLATLIYMERRPPATAPSTTLPIGVTLESYSTGGHPQFREAIEATYQETLDCPSLSGLRDADDVIAGHQSMGVFDPNLWSLVLVNGKPAGVLLLAEIPGRRALEIVYLGLAPFARGQSIGRALMHRVLAIGTRRGFDVLSLAVDAANVPATKLYRRAGYMESTRRVACVVSSKRC